jgi:hypothetical protein
MKGLGKERGKSFSILFLLFTILTKLFIDSVLLIMHKDIFEKQKARPYFVKGRKKIL